MKMFSNIISSAKVAIRRFLVKEKKGEKNVNLTSTGNIWHTFLPLWGKDMVVSVFWSI